jgi:hypothetical protein
MSSTKTRQIEWRFGSREENIQAWLTHPLELYMLVQFRPPNRDQWRSIMTVTWGWFCKHAQEPVLGAIWPALLIVPDGARSVIERSISDQLNLGWRLVLHNAGPLPGEPTLLDADDL